MKKVSKPLIALIVCIAVMIAAMGFASLVQTGYGSIDVSTWYFTDGDEQLSYKLYLPKGVSAEDPAPAVLVMHGYQNDKETNAAYCIELARRGIVALSLDEYGHGSTTIPMRERGYVTYSLRNLDKKLSGPQRFLTLSGFSSMDFFYDDIKGENLKDSSMGGKVAYRLLQAFDFVDEERMGITGHSMGTWSSWSVGAEYPDHDAIVLQCGELFPLDYYDSETVKFNNVLLIQSIYDEFDYFRDYQPDVRGLEATELRYHDFMGQDAPVEWNTTYGAFEDGSARRMELLNTNHRLATHNKQALTAAMDWFCSALGVTPAMAANDHIYMLKEVLVLVGMLAALGSLLPLLVLLTKTKFFAPIAQPLPGGPGEKLLPKGSWWKNAAIAILLSGATFPFLTQLGQGLLPLPESVFRMPIGNGFLTWLTFLMLVTLMLLLIWYKRGQGKKMGYTLYDLGLAPAGRQKVSWGVIGRSVLAAGILIAVMYLFTLGSTALFQLDFRFIWPFFKPFSAARFGQFWVYILFYIAYFIVSGGVKLFGQMRRPAQKSPALTQLAWWGTSVFLMLGGVLLVVLLEYIPFFMGFGPGADLLFGSTFGGPFMSIMILLIPQFIVFFFLMTYMYRKTGYVYVGSITVATLACWVVTGGSAFF